ncbi:Uncharacterised protein [Streptococcus suis]|nr:Uncharacterised protein [Streptococcus suis]
MVELGISTFGETTPLEKNRGNLQPRRADSPASQRNRTS